VGQVGRDLGWVGGVIARLLGSRRRRRVFQSRKVSIVDGHEEEVHTSPMPWTSMLDCENCEVIATRSREISTGYWKLIVGSSQFELR